MERIFELLINLRVVEVLVKPFISERPLIGLSIGLKTN